MKRTGIIVATVLLAGTVCGHLRRQTGQTTSAANEWTTTLGRRERDVATLRERLTEVQSMARRAKESIQALRHDTEQISPTVLKMLQEHAGGDLKTLPPEWRTPLDCGWERSADYVLIPKAALKPALSQTQICRTGHGFEMEPVTIAALGLSADQAKRTSQWAVDLLAASAQWERDSLRRTVPGSGVQVRYSIPYDPSGYARLVQTCSDALAM